MFLLLGERAEMPLSAPVAPRAADPAVENTASVELDVIVQAMHQFGELRFGVVLVNLVRHLGRRPARLCQGRRGERRTPA